MSQNIQASTSAHRIKNSDSNLRRLAFGNNTAGEPYENTCSAVACGIVLNYLDREYSTLFVKNNMESEVLDDVRRADLKQYPQAQALQHYLVDDCGIGEAAFGETVLSGIDVYRASTNETENTEVKASCILCLTIPQAESYIFPQIDQDKPAMISTAITGGEYEWHTMAVYGYNPDTDEILVHTGWWTNIHQDPSDNLYKIDEVWIPISYITYAYKFNFVTPLDTSAPTLLSANSTSPSTMQLKWEAVSGAEYYEIYRYDSSSGGLLDIVDSTTLTYEDSKLTPGELYTYRIKACKQNIDKIKFESDFSNEIMAKYILTAPQLSLIEYTNGSDTCTWTSIDDASGYELYRTDSPSGIYEKIATLNGANTVKYKDDYLSGGLTYFYKVRAYLTFDGKNIYSEYSNVQSAETYIFTYDIKSDNTLTITGYIGSNKDINIPSIIEGKTVTVIGGNAFSGSEITSIVIPDSLTTIENSAFSNTASLSSIAIPNSVTSIGEKAFSYSGISSISLPKKLTAINSGVFSYTANLSSITIPNSVTSIGEYAFCGSGITSITLPKNLTVINNGVFSQSKLASIIIPKKVTSIGENAFSECYELTDVTLYNNITEIGSWAFIDCHSLKNISIPKNINRIDSWAFTNCEKLASINLKGKNGNEPYIIDSYAFSGCTGLSSVSLDSAESLGDYAFTNCTGLKNVTLKNIKSLGMFAFYGCNSLEDVNMKNVDDIKMFAFNGLNSLQDVNVSGSETIESFAFSGCSNLTSAKIDAQELGFQAFGNCTHLAKLNLENTKDIGDSAFICCSALKKADIPDGTLSIGSTAFLGCSQLKNITLPNSLTSIGGNAFTTCTSLKEIEIPNSVTSLGPNAFANCTSLKKVTIPGSVQEISTGVFSGCSNLINVNLGEGIERIMQYAFENCTKLTNITIPSSVTYIDELAFYGSGVIINN